MACSLPPSSIFLHAGTATAGVVLSVPHREQGRPYLYSSSSRDLQLGKCLTVRRSIVTVKIRPLLHWLQPLLQCRRRPTSQDWHLQQPRLVGGLVSLVAAPGAAESSQANPSAPLSPCKASVVTHQQQHQLLRALHHHQCLWIKGRHQDQMERRPLMLMMRVMLRLARTRRECIGHMTKKLDWLVLG
uniref:Uncharacterized protein n=1 Tax=Arundo donax TaxID=35708 RepID=A0A0A9D3B7_ARUDO